MNISIFLSIVVFATLIISLYTNNRKHSLGIQTISCLTEALYCFTINAFTSAALNIVNSIRSLIFVNNKKFNIKIYWMILFFFEGIIIFSCFYTWAGPISLLPTIGSLFRTFCLWQTKQSLVRVSGVVTGLTYGMYYLYYQSWIMLAGDALLFVAGLVAIYKYDIKKTKK